MGGPTHQRSVEQPLLMRSLALRGVTILVLLTVVLLLPQTIGDPGLRSVIPLFSLIIFLQLMPLFWARKPDLFSPPIMLGIFAAHASLATMVSWIARGRVELPL